VTDPAHPRIAGIVLAAGAGSRYGGPKALVRDADGTPWVVRAVEALRAGGCGEVVVVLGAEAAQASALVPGTARIAVAADWAGGLSRSLSAGLDAAAGADAAVIVPVDTPDLPATAVARVVAAAPALRNALVRATYRGRPGHPALVGAEHWAHLRAELAGDVGAGPFLARHGAVAVECGDLWRGLDQDEPG
jgi:CTP:molybdopterin cytidylyltransferase MocA